MEPQNNHPAPYEEYLEKNIHGFKEYRPYFLDLFQVSAKNLQYHHQPAALPQGP